MVIGCFILSLTLKNTTTNINPNIINIMTMAVVGPQLLPVQVSTPLLLFLVYPTLQTAQVEAEKQFSQLARQLEQVTPLRKYLGLHSLQIPPVQTVQKGVGHTLHCPGGLLM